MLRRIGWLLPFALFAFACSDDADPKGVDDNKDAASNQDAAKHDANTDAGITEPEDASSEGSSPTEDVVQPDVETDASVILEAFVLIDSGSFSMGSPLEELGRSSDMEALHEVTFTRSWMMKATEVTQKEWEDVMGNNPSFFPECGADCPVDYITFYDALAWCNARSEDEGLPPCYELEGCTGEPGIDLFCQGVKVKTQDENPLLCEGYRLPTEAEWEYGARAGTTTAFATGDFQSGESDDCELVSALDGFGWYCGNAEDSPHPAGKKQANAWGLYDVAGNALEWVWDRYAPYPETSVTDPLGDSSEPLRVLRGGSWSQTAGGCRSAARKALDPVERDGDIGFRPVRTVSP